MARPGRKPAVLDINQLAAAIAEIATGKGGLKGGPARAKQLGKKKLQEAARKAALARWTKK
jgi:hypothetical protein